MKSGQKSNNPIPLNSKSKNQAMDQNNQAAANQAETQATPSLLQIDEKVVQAMFEILQQLPLAQSYHLFNAMREDLAKNNPQ